MPSQQTPSITEDSREFWQYTLDDKLMLKKCVDCSRFIYYPRILCPHCMSTNLAWTEAEGTGVIYSFTTLFRAPNEEHKKNIPYMIAIVELAEGVRLLSNITDCAPENTYIDMPVQVHFDCAFEEMKLPKFRPVQSK